ncbi:uncharacterized protein LOC126894073 isoform X2 [Daktulosphaira vitifoliae]|uniref:uncharacterized protein LOC126894073 isoform X2 n=1 Tax=Daktulosphaira vitifoliae TaxID=58002 RepID=UPI0021A98280|nr:uncharacterized protein LOC126894073 isoform X2 [Daktulosphaira vitifoliae]
MIYQFKIVLFASCIISTLCFPNSSGPSNTEASSSEIPDNDHGTVLSIFKSQVKKELSSGATNDNGLIVYDKLVWVCFLKYGINIRKGMPSHIYDMMRHIPMKIDDVMELIPGFVKILINKLADDLRSHANNGYIPLGDAREIFEKHELDKEIRTQTLYKVETTRDQLLKVEDIINLLK